MPKKSEDINRLFSLKNDIAIVTGGQGVLGSQYVKTLAEAGAKVAIFDISKKINPLVKKLIRNGHKIASYTVDITNRKAVEKAVR